MIIRTGIDIERVERVARLVETHEDRRERVWTPNEIEFCERFGRRRRIENYAGVFAAKEAVMKALGTGWRAGVEWSEIEILAASGGAKLTGETRRVAESQGVARIAVSWTASGEIVTATAVAESEEQD